MRWLEKSVGGMEGDLKRMRGQWWKLARQVFELFTEQCLQSGVGW
ncbi:MULTISPECIES: hypothetical protein [unclassified Bartonella]|nr:hypothetical protein [Bartonella sp. CM31XJBT]